jgi:hypothetical protein
MTERTWLIQRLCKPMQREGRFMPASGPFTFGGGKRHGGLSEVAVAMLGTIFSFDYMGAAEFEFGAVADAISALVEAFHHGTGQTGMIDTAKWKPKPHHEIFYICRKADEEYVKTIIPTLAAFGLKYELYGSFKESAEERAGRETLRDGGLKIGSKKQSAGDLRLKEGVRFADALYDMDAGRYIGWLELDNKFVFFTDKEAFDKMVRCVSDPGAYAKEMGVPLE